MESAYEILARAQTRAPFPMTATLELTRRCNARCAHCYLELDGHPGPEFATVERVLRELGQAGTLMLVLTGGEITLRPDWLDIVRVAHTLGFATTIKTNGLLWSAAAVSAIADIGVLSVDVSLHGARREAHDAVTNLPGSFDGAMATVKRLREAGVTVTFVHPALKREDGQAEGVSRLATELGCRLVLGSRVVGTMDGRCSNRSLWPDEDCIEALYRVAHARGATNVAPDFDSSNDAAWPCLSDDAALSIQADGEIRRCVLLRRALGTVYGGPVPETWRLSRARAALREEAASWPSACKLCQFRATCRRCPAAALAEHGSLDAPATVDCSAARARALLARARPVGRGEVSSGRP
ncbi:MAG: radical SAM protein [Acidobacteriota bacterium]